MSELILNEPDESQTALRIAELILKVSNEFEESRNRFHQIQKAPYRITTKFECLHGRRKLGLVLTESK